MEFVSTRGEERVTGARAIVQGIAKDGGLFVPERFPKVSEAEITQMLEMDYPERAALVIGKYFDEYDGEKLLVALQAAYARFEENDAAPLVRIEDGTYILELFHGPTCAFKDMALTVLPYLLAEGCRLTGVKEKILVLAATSGDTGKAALEGFKDADGVKVMTFYPDEGVSKMQKQQMCTTEGENVNVVAVKGNFDDCQTGVKRIFASEECKQKLAEKGYVLSSANSINIGRLIPQVAYYFSAYCDLLSSGQIEYGDKVDFAVPTGNFGNILAAFYAKNMGLPIGKLICASNENKVLYDFFATGAYDRNREFVLTSSPSMDILISSNLERLIYRIAGNDPEKNRRLMKSLQEEGRYEITEEMRRKLAEFYGNYASESETSSMIRETYRESGYILDTHTAVAAAVYKKYREETKDETKTVIASTASPYKFTRSVMTAIDEKYAGKEDFELVDELAALSGVKAPMAIEEIRTAPVRHKTVCEVSEMKAVVKEFLHM